MKEERLEIKNKEVGEGEEEYNNDPNFDRKFDLVTAGAQPFVKEHLLHRVSRVNLNLIISYILALQTEVSARQSYRIETILKLKQLSEFHNGKSFRDMTRQDAIDFLDRLRPKSEASDPLHKWIGTYENNRIYLLRFFKWLYSPDLPPAQRPKPAVMANIPKIRRLEKSIYKPTDIWTHEDDLLFCKYCPSKRDQAYFRVARDTGCRPHEMVNIRIKDLVKQPMEDGSQVAIVMVNGKTGPRPVRIFRAYPYLKDWLANGHPFPNVLDVPVFCGTGKKNTGRKISAHTVGKIFAIYKNKSFPKLLESPTVSAEDKRKISELLKKPWNPHFRRHTATTEISKNVKDPVLINKYMGWSQSGNTRQRYQHYGSNDAIEQMLIIDGLIPLAADGSSSSKVKKDLLKPVICPDCDEPNKPDSKICSKCRLVLDWDTYNQTIGEAEETKKALEEMKVRQASFEQKTSEQVNALVKALKKMIASEMDYDLTEEERGGDPNEAAKLEDAFSRAITPNGDYFGDESDDNAIDRYLKKNNNNIMNKK